ncbi:PH domain-containing protein [Nocardiopsis gilva]|uniref:PH domain-containing protein n=1 Tax=Nocardiopsis gilva TaxID=280236 RepID=UPI00034649AC|nr:PH domain-containing protein [Nocardiopsis gilva]
MKPFTAPLSRVLGWVWIGVVVLLLIDLLVNGGGRTAVVAAAVLLCTVGATYVLWLRPRVAAQEDGVRVVNPLRETFVPWAAFTWADVTDVLRIHAGGQVIRSWPLRETKRAVVRDNLRRAGSDGGPILEEESDDPRELRPVNLVARQLREEAQRRKAEPTAAAADDSGALSTVWSPDALVALGVPVLLLVAALLVG